MWPRFAAVNFDLVAMVIDLVYFSAFSNAYCFWSYDFLYFHLQPKLCSNWPNVSLNQVCWTSPVIIRVAMNQSLFASEHSYLSGINSAFLLVIGSPFYLLSYAKFCCGCWPPRGFSSLAHRQMMTVALLASDLMYFSGLAGHQLRNVSVLETVRSLKSV